MELSRRRAACAMSTSRHGHARAGRLLHTCNCMLTIRQQPPIQLNSLTGTYATSTYLAALKKGPKDLETLAKDVEAFDKQIKDDSKIAAFIRASTLILWQLPGASQRASKRRCR